MSLQCRCSTTSLTVQSLNSVLRLQVGLAQRLEQAAQLFAFVVEVGDFLQHVPRPRLAALAGIQFLARMQFSAIRG